MESDSNRERLYFGSSAMFDWLSFTLYILLIAGSPGPNTITSMSNGARRGFVKGLPYVFGIFCGLVIVSVFCALCCNYLSSLVPKIKAPMVVLGALYILFLAWKTYKRNADMEEKSFEGSFASGFLMQFVNPKLFMICILTMTSYVLPYCQGRILLLLGFAILLPVIFSVLNLCYSAFGAAFRRLFSVHGKAVNTVMALLLVYCAIKLFLSAFRA